MKKLMLAISGVFCLQLGFIAYNAADPSAETSFVVVDKNATDRNLAARVAEPVVYERTIADISFEPTDSDTMATQFATTSRRPDAEPGHSARLAVSTRRKRPALSTYVSRNSVENLTPVTILYQRHEAIVFKPQPEKPRTEYPGALMSYQEPKTYELSAKAASRPKKKGFFAKALPVLKKPYNWLKAVGSIFR